MWKRFVRAIRSLFGKAVTAIEDPKLILEQNIRDLNDQVPKMNENIATVKASVMLLEKEVRKYQDEQADLVSKMKAAINGGRDDIAGQYAMRLETNKRNLQQTKGQLETAQAAYAKSLDVKKAFMKEKDRKIAEAKEALRAHERAKWQSKIADTLQSFEVGGLDETHNDMLNRLNEQTALNEAKMEMALDSVDTSGMKLEEEAEKLRAQELVKQFKMEMGMDSKVEKPIQDSGSPLDNRDKTV